MTALLEGHAHVTKELTSGVQSHCRVGRFTHLPDTLMAVT